jgi:uncharacterized membrane protein
MVVRQIHNRHSRTGVERYRPAVPVNDLPAPRRGYGMIWAKGISRHVLAIFIIGAGAMHFANPDFYLKIMPPYLPFHLELVELSGICEIVLGILLVIPRYSRQAAGGIIVLLIAVFPANLHVYQHQDLIPGSPVLHLMRLPLQALLVLWAWWHTKPADIPITPKPI